MSAKNAVRLHRVLAAPPEKIYRAFLDPDARARWLPPNGFTGKVHHSEPKVGGTYRMSFTNFTTGSSHSFHGEYRELIENERLRYTDMFDDPNLPGEIVVTVTLKPVSVGTDVTIVQENLPDAIPVARVLPGLAGISAQPCAPGGARHSGRGVTPCTTW